MPGLPPHFTIITSRLTLRVPAPDDIARTFDATQQPTFNDGMVWDAPASIDELVPLVEAARVA